MKGAKATINENENVHMNMTADDAVKGAEARMASDETKTSVRMKKDVYETLNLYRKTLTLIYRDNKNERDRNVWKWSRCILIKMIY